MDFSVVLGDIQKLVGLRLEAINPSTGYVELVSLNIDANNYYMKLNGNKEKSRPISQLKIIWEALVQERSVNVETALEGSGSSRHIPETLLANLPYIEYFKYRRKKHLFLNSHATHEIGTTKEISSSDLKIVKSRLDNLSKFNRVAFSNDFDDAVQLLYEAGRELKVKFPGDFQASKISEVETKLADLLKKISGTVVPRDDETDSDYIEIISSDTDMIDLDAPEFTGFDGGKNETIEGPYEKNTSFESIKQMSASRIRFLPLTVSLVYDRILHNEIELQPDFQRKDRIWPASNKSALIESILIGLPIPTFYFAERPSGIYVIVDGLQRITTFYDFIGDKFKLEGLKFRKEFNGYSFKDLPRPDQRKIREYQLHGYVIAIQKDNDEMVRELFQRINTYGVKMSYQEIRCALYPGSSVKFIKKVAESISFKNATFGKIQAKRMRDMELVLGAIVFALYGFESFDEKKFDNFLTNGMQVLNKHNLELRGNGRIPPTKNVDSKLAAEFSPNTSELYFNLAHRLEASFNLAILIFESDRYKKEMSGKVINKALFEMITSTFLLLNDQQREELLKRKDEVKNGLYDLITGNRAPYVAWSTEHYKGRSFEYSITQSTGKRVTILYRFKNFQALLEDILKSKISLKGLLEDND